MEKHFSSDLKALSIKYANKVRNNRHFQKFVPTVLLSISYLGISVYLVGFKVDQLVLIGLFNTAYFLSQATRKFMLGFSIFIVYWVIFDYMKAFPNYLFMKVHIEDLYTLEKQLFGINVQGLILTPNEFWNHLHHALLDVLTGFFYLMWVPVPLLFAAYLFFKNKHQFLRFSLTFLWVNLLGFVLYYLYPAAPPWYVVDHGFEFIPDTKGNMGGLSRFDTYFSISLFRSIYAKGSNVFAAMPSLHSAYPVILVYYGWKTRLNWLNAFFVVLTLGIWFAAVYNSHHYVLDVLMGLLCAVIAIITFNGLIQLKLFKSALLRFYLKIR